MIIYFANRAMSILGQASTGLMAGLRIREDSKEEDIESGVAVFSCKIAYADDTRELAEDCTAPGNYILRKSDSDNEFYTIIESELDTEAKTIYIYAEDAGLDLLNEICTEYSDDTEYTLTEFIEMWTYDSGFEIGVDESDSSETMAITGREEETTTERLLYIAGEFGYEIGFSFAIKNLKVTHKYIDIYKEHGKEVESLLKLNRDVKKITITKSVANLATALLVTGATPDNSDIPVTLEDYEYDDGDFYVDGHKLKSRSALAKWSRYVNPDEPEQIDNVGHIVKTFTYDTLDQEELLNQAIEELKSIYDTEVNYECEISHLPDGIKIGDRVNLVDEAGKLYLSTRILKLTTSIVDNTRTATLGEYLIKDSGISAEMQELVEQFSSLAASRTFYTWIAYADDTEGNGISLDSTGKAYVGISANHLTEEVDISDPSIFTWSLVQGSGTGVEEITYYYGVSDSSTEQPTEWSNETPTADSTDAYIWTYTETEYTDGTSKTTTPYVVTYYGFLQVDEIAGKVASFDELYVEYAEIDELMAEYGYIKDLDVDSIIADYGYITELEVETLLVENGYITNLEVQDLIASYAYISEADISDLRADVASITTLLAGSESVSTLEAIHLTTDNAVIDSAVIEQAYIDNAAVSSLLAGNIYTNFVTIQPAEGDKSLYITESIIAMYDDNDIQRLQAGMSSEDEGYNFVIWGADGTELFNATGITASGIPSETIVNEHVAENAAIKGTKLDIESVIKSIEDDGSMRVDYANVVIDNTTLAAEYTTIKTAVDIVDVLQTEFEVDSEEGKITNRVWETYTDEAIGELSDEYATLVISMESIESSIGRMISTFVESEVEYRNYALLSGNYTEGGSTGWIGLQNYFDSYYTITTYDGYTRAECIASTSSSYRVFLPLSDDLDNTVTHTISVRIRPSSAVAIGYGHRYFNSGSTSASYGGWTKAASNFTAGEWTEFTQTWTPDTTQEYTHFYIMVSNLNTVGDYLDIEYVMYEQGSVAHDWEPAPEDGDPIKYVTSVINQFSAITETIDSISLEVTNAMATAQSAYDLASSIEMDTESITATVKATLGLSYRNYLLQSGGFVDDSDISGWYSSSTNFDTNYAVSVADEGYVRIECVTTNTNPTHIYIPLSDAFEGGKTYNIIAKVRPSKATGYAFSRVYKNASTGSGGGSGTISGASSVTKLTAGEWNIVSTTWSTSDTYLYTYCGIYLATSNYFETHDEGDYLDIAYMIVQESDAEEDTWLPAPEDLGFDATVLDQYSTIEQLSDSITLAVFKDSETGYLRLGTGDDDTVQFTVEASNFSIDENGDAYFKGDVYATSFSLAGVTFSVSSRELDKITFNSDGTIDTIEYWAGTNVLELDSEFAFCTDFLSADNMYANSGYIHSFGAQTIVANSANLGGNLTCANIGTTYSNTATITCSSGGVDSYTAGGSITLPAGTYVLVAKGIFTSNTTVANRRVQIYDATNSQSITIQSSYGANYIALHCSYIVTITSDTTYTCRLSTGIGSSLSSCTALIQAVRIN